MEYDSDVSISVVVARSSILETSLDITMLPSKSAEIEPQDTLLLNFKDALYEDFLAFSAMLWWNL